MQQAKNTVQNNVKDTERAFHHAHALQIAEAIAAFAAKMRPPNRAQLPS